MNTAIYLRSFTLPAALLLSACGAEAPAPAEAPGRAARAIGPCPGTSPPGGLVLTFDDTYIDNWHDQLRPVLQRYGARATFFVTRAYTLNAARRSKLLALQAAGHEIGAHTMDHASAYDYSPQSYLVDQVLPDVAELTAIGVPPRSFAYPYGHDVAEVDAELLQIFDHVRDTRNSEGGSGYVPDLHGAFRRCDGDRRVAAVGLDETYGHGDAELLDGLDRARCEGSNLLVYSHHFGTPPPGSTAFYTRAERVELLLREAAARGLRTRRLRDLCSWHASARGSAAPARVFDSPLRRGDVRFADLDGDGRSDAFQATGTQLEQWRVLRNRGGTFYAPSGDERWTELGRSDVTLPDLVLHDFDGDRRADVLYGDGFAWFLSSGGAAVPRQLSRRTELMSQLGFGDFNGDGKTDVLRISRSRWQVSYGATSAWTQINNQAGAVAELGFGDFNGDGRTDALRASGGQWQVSYGAATAWTALRSGVSETPAQLRFGDFDGDGKTDALRATGAAWEISSAAAGPWVRLRASTVPLSELSVLDLNGDRVADLLYTAAPAD